MGQDVLLDLALWNLWVPTWPCMLESLPGVNQDTKVSPGLM